MFPLYLAAKRKAGCWGDDPEIQAICELYNRPAEIWAFDPKSGARKLRTFHESRVSHSGKFCIYCSLCCRFALERLHASVCVV